LQGTNSIVHGGILGQLCKLPVEDPGETQAQKYNTVHTGSTAAWLTTAAATCKLNHSQVAISLAAFSLFVGEKSQGSIRTWGTQNKKTAQLKLSGSITNKKIKLTKGRRRIFS